MAARGYGQYDGVTRGLELVGERWALRLRDHSQGMALAPVAQRRDQRERPLL